MITIDPPPPLPAAGSSLLYSEEFYQVARQRLRPGGILQQWLPVIGADAEVIAAVARSLRNSFPYIRTFADETGFHFLCSNRPIPSRSPQDLLQRMPASAVADFAEWAPPSSDGGTGASYLQFVTLLMQEFDVDRLVAEAPNTPALSDDRPVNEYYALRHWLRSENPSASKRGSQ